MSPKKWIAAMSAALAASAAAACAETPSSAAPEQGPAVETRGETYVMPRSDVRKMTSEDGAEYLIYIAWPAEAPPPEGYPALYLLDGTESFAVAAEFANRLGVYSGMRPGVVIGIGYPGATRRELDYTPDVAPDPEGPPMSGPTGGAEAFLSFIENDVIASVEKDIPIDSTRRTIAGYSLGGLLTLQALFERPDLFRTYVASSPSIWWGGKYVVSLAPGLAEKLPADASPRRLFLTVGQYEQSPMPGKEEDPSWLKIAELSKYARMNDNAQELFDMLQSTEGLETDLEVMPNETHATGDLVAIRAALLHAFADQY